MGLFKGSDFAFADIDPEGDSWLSGLKAGKESVGSGIVEAHTIDDCFVFGESEQARFGISGLGMSGDGSNFDKAEPKSLPLIESKAVFIESGGESDRVWECDAEEGFFETGIAIGSSSHEPFSDRGHGQVVHFFCIASKEEGAK